MKNLMSCFFLFFLTFQTAFAEPFSLKSTVKGETLLGSYADSTADGYFFSDVLSSAVSASFESSLNLNHNLLIGSPKAWFVEIPYAEIALSYNISKNSLITAKFELAFQNKSWSYFIEDFFVQQKIPFAASLNMRWGYFSYPASYAVEVVKVFSKKTLLYQNLFPFGRQAVGILAQGRLWESLYWLSGLQADIQKRGTGPAVKTLSPVFTVGLMYKNRGQEIFLKYFQNQLVFEGERHNLGLGSNLRYKFGIWTMALQGEFWHIQNHVPVHTLLSYYVFPSLRWRFVSLAFLFGGAHHDLQSDQSHILEYILKGNIHLTESLTFALERIKEVDSLVKRNSWAFSLKTSFKI